MADKIILVFINNKLSKQYYISIALDLVMLLILTFDIIRCRACFEFHFMQLIRRCWMTTTCVTRSPIFVWYKINVLTVGLLNNKSYK